MREIIDQIEENLLTPELDAVVENFFRGNNNLHEYFIYLQRNY